MPFCNHSRYFYGEVYNYEGVLRKLSLVSVKDSLYIRDILFLRGVVRGETKMPSLLSSLNFRVPRFFRRVEVFYVTQNVGIPSRLALRLNRVADPFDMFAMPREGFLEALHLAIGDL